MIAILSPAKNMKAVDRPDIKTTAPRYLEQTRALWDKLRSLAPHELESVLHINPRLALRACADFAEWQDRGGTAAALAFDGLAYRYLDAHSLSKWELEYAQEHLRLLSSFYGPLRPLDAIHPYRLELAHRIGGQSLYRFWDEAYYRDVFASGEPVIDLASKEYSRAVRAFVQPGDRLIACNFLVYSRGKLRCLPAIAKMARGAMARFIIQNQLDGPEQLPFFDWNGFQFEGSLSSEAEMVFITRG